MMGDWKLFRGDPTNPHDAIEDLPPPPPWRDFSLRGGETHDTRRGRTYRPSPTEVEMVNAALYLRRPLLITGKTGTGKSTLAYAVAEELKLGPVLSWPITSRTTMAQGLYLYDAVGRLQEARAGAAADIGRYIRLGPLGTALLPAARPRVLLIDEIDKSDIDLPNDLLHVFEEGRFIIPELARLSISQPEVSVAPADGGPPARIEGGLVRCTQFPLVIMTDNAEREFPPPFLRRCLRLGIDLPGREKLGEIVKAHFRDEDAKPAEPGDGRKPAEVRDQLIDYFLKRRDEGDLATDQLLNAVYLVMHRPVSGPVERDELVQALLRHLTQAQAP